MTKKSKKNKKRQRRRSLKIFFICLLTALLAAVLVRLFWIETVHVASDAMSPRYISGDIVAVNKLVDVTEIKRGDVVYASVGGFRLIRQVAGIEGDLIDVRDGVRYLVNAETGEEIRLGDGLNLNYGTIPHGAYFLLSLQLDEDAPDSRGLGLIKRSDIIAVPGSVLWPPARMFKH
ncbi:MAG: signal peptidase I [Clostridiales bacterium]|nr:signal peptidase I [Clostridiales bacterium]